VQVDLSLPEWYAKWARQTVCISMDVQVCFLKHLHTVCSWLHLWAN